MGQGLDPEVTHTLGRAYASVLRETLTGARPRVVVGRDNRPSSPGLAEGLVSGILAGGVDVLDVGVVPTPVTYWTERDLGLDGSLQVTGSHNPSEYNGIKMTMRGRPFFGPAIQELRTRIEAGKFRRGSGAYSEAGVLDAYMVDVVGRFELARPLRAVVDCGNGAGSLVAQPLLEALGAEVIPLFCESDGTFPNHHPDPTVDEYLEDLIENVHSSGADVGLAFDGDADRLGVVDEGGRIVRGDVLLLLFGLDLLERWGPGQKLIFDVKCSQVLPEVFARAGGEPIMWKTGHSHIKEKMRETRASLGGELSGHICFADDYLGIDDALYDACRFLDLLARAGRPLSELVAELPAYASTPELRIEVGEERKFFLIEAARRHFAAAFDLIEVDGVRILFGDGWGLLRASNTQPILVARFEAATPERLEEIQELVLGWLESQGIHV